MMKKLNCTIRGLVLCLGILMMLCAATESQAAKDLSVIASAKNKTTVEVTWKKKSVSGYEIYRAKRNKSGEYTYYQKIATVSGKKKKYIDKTAGYKNWYSYKVKAYKKQRNKKIYKYEGSYETYTGMIMPNLLTGNEYLVTTANSIQFNGETGGIAPTAFEIYRKEGSLKYKKIKTIKAKNAYYTFEYVDKDVTKGKTYSYKVRTYKTINGKKLYSKYSKAKQITAINSEASYEVQNYTKENGKTKSIVIGLTSKEGNGDTLLEFDGSEYSNISYYSNCNESGSIDLVPVKYSFDNVTWNSFPDKGIRLSEKQTIYVMLEAVDGKEFDFVVSGVSQSDITWWVTYHNVECQELSIDIIHSKAWLGLYHS